MNGRRPPPNPRHRGPTGAVLALGLALAGIGCGGSHRYVVDAEQQLFLRTNLPYDSSTNVVSSVLYSGLPGTEWLAVCTPVHIVEMSRDEIDFATESGERFVYHRTGHSRIPITDHAYLYFGEGCPDVGTMSGEDQRGIRDHTVYVGMSEDGVRIAVGHPPDHATLDPDSDTWTYWRTRFDTFEVGFEHGIVARVTD